MILNAKKGNNGSNTFDASQMRMHLKQHIELVGDLMTTTENIEEYAEFLGALNDLNRMTEDYDTLSPEGTYPLMTEDGKKQLQTAYQNAMKAAGQIVLGEETGAVNAQMRTIAGELLPMLETDNAALEMTNVSREPGCGRKRSRTAQKPCCKGNLLQGAGREQPDSEKQSQARRRAES